MDIAGPYAGADNDLNMLAKSNTLHNIGMSLATAHLPADYDVVTDKIYAVIVPHLASLVKDPAPGIETEDNQAASGVRVPSEWGFGKTKTLFKFTSFASTLKINEREVGNYILVATLLTNAHTCLYAGEAATFFSHGNAVILPPTLEEYFDL